MTRPIQVVIHKSAIRHNISLLRQKTGVRKFWAVTKADAYGHGLLGILDALDGADGLALLDMEAALMVRQAGWTKPIMLIEGFFEIDDIPLLSEFELETVIHNVRQIEMLEQAGVSKELFVHLKVNSGMNRLGFRPCEVNRIIERLCRIPNVRVVDYVNHFANAEKSYPINGRVSVEEQLSRLKVLKDQGLRGCLSNTSAILWRNEAGGIAVRAGVAMYGVSPDMEVKESELGIQAAMTFTSQIIAIQNLIEGEAVGYGSRFVAQRASRIGIVACGYADGYPRSARDGTSVWVDGRIVPLVGAVSMDMLAVDLTDHPRAKEGSQVELWGSHVPVNEVARNSGTIGYELICSLTRRVNVSYEE